jgi:hypothetical protein
MEVVVHPMKKLIALARERLGGSSVTGLYRPDENVNEVLTPLVNQSCHRSVVEIIESPPNQRKSITGRVYHHGRKIELAVKPRFDGVLVRGSHIREMVHHERSHMTCYQLGCEDLHYWAVSDVSDNELVALREVIEKQTAQR